MKVDIWLPKVGHKMKASCLPRDIRLGWSHDNPKGTLLYGWDTISNTRQLWEVSTPGKDGEAVFIGFLTNEA